jgi:hypothetical protein
MASNGFRRLLVKGNFQKKEDAEEAHKILDSLEYELPEDYATDASFYRWQEIGMFFPDGELSAPLRRLKADRVTNEP